MQESDTIEYHNEKKREDAAYENSEKIRRELLKDARDAVETAAQNWQRQHSKFGNLLLQPKTWEIPTDFRSCRAISTDHYVDEAGSLAKLLADHAEIAVKWRGEIVKRLLKSVNRDVDTENEDDDQYQENLDAQHEAEAYLEMYGVLLAERELIITGTAPVGSRDRPTAIGVLDREVKEFRRRSLLPGCEAPTEGEQKVHEVRRLTLEHYRSLDSERERVSLSAKQLPLSELPNRVSSRKAVFLNETEALMVNKLIAELRSVIKSQKDLLDNVRRDMALLSELFNARAEYFRHMQHLSDSVADYRADDLKVAYARLRSQEQRHHIAIGGFEHRLRYLEHLNKSRRSDHEIQECFMCTEVIRKGVLTDKCGHVACDSCFNQWIAKRRACPMCNTRIEGPKDYHRIVYGEIEGEATGRERILPLHQLFHLSQSERLTFETKLSQGRYGSKIDLLVKHALHIWRTKGEKMLVFSSFDRGLELVEEALRANGLRSILLRGGGNVAGRTVDAFRKSADIPVLLLHAEAQSSGLNLVCASTIFLVEPLVSHALELQALGRIDRIGQMRPTEAFSYLVLDTVEEKIALQSFRKGNSLYAQSTTHKASPEISITQNYDASQQTHTRAKGDFITSTDDVFNCLF